MHSREQFAANCRAAGLRALPAHYTTIAGHLGAINLRGTVAAGSLGSYLAPVTTITKVEGYPVPPAHPIFQRLRREYLRVDAERAGELTEYSGPLPDDVVPGALLCALRRKDTATRRVCAGLVLAFLMFNRPGAAAIARAADLAFTAQGLRVRLPQHKSAARSRAQHAFLIPCHPKGYTSDLPLQFLPAYARDFLAAGGSSQAPLFADGSPPSGPRVEGHCLRSVLS